MKPTSLDQLRTAMKFSYWAWAAYWPAMGLMLLFAGMRDPVSLVFALLCLGSFAVLVASRSLSATASRNVREFLIERPFYLLAAVGIIALFGSSIPIVANLGLALFSGTFLASLVFVGIRMRAHVLATGTSVFRSRADQVFLLLAITFPAALLVFIDSIKATGVGNPAASVVAVNWLCFAYPPLMLLASRPFREPLVWSLRRKTAVAPKPVAAAEATD